MFKKQNNENTHKRHFSEQVRLRVMEKVVTEPLWRQLLIRRRSDIEQ